jgi:hypothetical protein
MTSGFLCDLLVRLWRPAPLGLLVPRLVGSCMQLANEVTLLHRLGDVIDQRLHIMPVAQKRCPARIRNGLCNVTRQEPQRNKEGEKNAALR